MAIPNTEEARLEIERFAFEAWMAGRCWPLYATWDGQRQQYHNAAVEQGSYVDSKATVTRQLWAAWRDRAALAHQPVEDEDKWLMEN